ncbi:uncharacterized protein G2W53_038249 [Senna tora]|uniref:Uncharacterized protein n=1 Tax=Senna tora TaxID=362788 RepID=A0A834W1Z0_9FABA|nr:uncharacterized protein G2W53_038249 [Senna tora]
MAIPVKSEQGFQQALEFEKCIK